MKEYRCKLCNKEIIRDWGRPKTWCSIKCKYMYNNSKRKSTKRTKQIECKTCNSLSLNKYCSRLCYPQVGRTWYKIQKFKQLKKELENIGYLLRDERKVYMKKYNEMS